MSNGSARLRLALAVLALVLTGVLAWRADAAEPRSAVVRCNGVIGHAASGTEDGYRAYAGRVYLDARRECVPLKAAVGDATRTEWFGIGTACRQA